MREGGKERLINKQSFKGKVWGYDVWLQPSVSLRHVNYKTTINKGKFQEVKLEVSKQMLEIQTVNKGLHRHKRHEGSSIGQRDNVP